jgi:hypothetical protein
MTQLPPIKREDLSAALRDAAIKQMEWAASKDNNGPFSEEAYRISIHLSEALNGIAYAVLHPGVVGK